MPNKVPKLYPPLGKKKLWRLPQIHKPILIIGDSNLSNIKEVRQTMKNQVQIISYPGARFEDLYEILKNMPNPILQVKHLILSVGINNRGQNANATSNKHIGNLYFQATKKFPNAKIYYPHIGHRLSSDREMQNLQDFEWTWRNLGSTILPSVSVTRTTSDGIHWTPETARCLLDLWLNRLSLN